jgi:hypothetical protein
MKKSLVVIYIGMTFFSFGQISEGEFEQVVESAADMYRRMDYRRETGGHKADTNFVFQNTLLKLFRGTLDADSLIATQPQLPLITVNEFITDPVYTQNAIDFFKKPDFIKYNTADYVFTHRVSNSTGGYHRETISNNSENEQNYYL